MMLAINEHSAANYLEQVEAPTLIFAGILLHYFTKGMEDSGLTWISLVAIGLIMVATMIIDWFSGAVGARWFGSRTKTGRPSPRMVSPASARTGASSSGTGFT